MLKKAKKIALLGATSHIAKGIIFNFQERDAFYLHLYTRSAQKMKHFLDTFKMSNMGNFVIHQGYTEFTENHYDVVINCVGVGTENKLKGDYSLYFTVTEEYDNLVIHYLRNINRRALYISFSSGAVYGRGNSAPVEENSLNPIKVNHVTAQDYYAIARLNAEAKHRSLHGLNIVDLRVFSYFSRLIDLADGYFITKVIDCILKNKVFVTDNINMIRDYANPKDLFRIIRKCMAVEQINCAFDVVSSKPVEKMEILNLFSSEYNLAYEVKNSLSHFSPTGLKHIYCSKYNKLKDIGFKPEFSSMDTIKNESKVILDSRLAT